MSKTKQSHQKTFKQMRSECQGLRSAHKRIKEERDIAYTLLEKVLDEVVDLDCFQPELHARIKLAVGAR